MFDFKCKCWIEKNSVPMFMQGSWKSMIPISLNLRLFYRKIERTYYTGTVDEFMNDEMKLVKEHITDSKYPMKKI